MSKAQAHSWDAVQTARRWTREQATWVLGELARSGLGVAAFSKLHELDPQRLYCWRVRLKEGASPKLIEVTLPRALALPRSTPARVDIELVGGRRLSVAESIDVQLLQRLVAALER